MLCSVCSERSRRSNSTIRLGRITTFISWTSPPSSGCEGRFFSTDLLRLLSLRREIAKRNLSYTAARMPLTTGSTGHSAIRVGTTSLHICTLSLLCVRKPNKFRDTFCLSVPTFRVCTDVAVALPFVFAHAIVVRSV